MPCGPNPQPPGTLAATSTFPRLRADVGAIVGRSDVRPETNGVPIFPLSYGYRILPEILFPRMLMFVSP